MSDGQRHVRAFVELGACCRSQRNLQLVLGFDRETLSGRETALDVDLSGAIGKSHHDAGSRNRAVVERWQQIEGLERACARTHLQIGVGESVGGQRAAGGQRRRLRHRNRRFRGQVSVTVCKVKRRRRAQNLKRTVFGQVDHAARTDVILCLGQNIQIFLRLQRSGNRDRSCDRCLVVFAVDHKVAFAFFRFKAAFEVILAVSSKRLDRHVFAPRHSAVDIDACRNRRIFDLLGTVAAGKQKNVARTVGGLLGIQAARHTGRGNDRAVVGDVDQFFKVLVRSTVGDQSSGLDIDFGGGKHDAVACVDAAFDGDDSARIDRHFARLHVC